MQTQIWAHVRSGEWYAVTVDDSGQVVEAAGPLHYSEVAAVLRDGFNGDGEVADDLQALAAWLRAQQPPAHLAELVAGLADQLVYGLNAAAPAAAPATPGPVGPINTLEG